MITCQAPNSWSRFFALIDGYTDVAVVVSDAVEAKKWYVEKLGFKVVLDRGHAVCVSPDVEKGGLYLHLCGDNFASLEPGNTGIGFTADEFEKTCEDMMSKGVRFSQPPADEDGYKSAKFLDMDGNEFWLFESSLANIVRQNQ
jgi:catechol 2,3-dioxygenase-like lactoylglutathione lyase family enzyme